MHAGGEPLGDGDEVAPRGVAEGRRVATDHDGELADGGPRGAATDRRVENPDLVGGGPVGDRADLARGHRAVHEHDAAGPQRLDEAIRPEHDLLDALDPAFAVPADEALLEQAVAALREKGFTVHVADTVADARAMIATLLPRDQEIFTASSETLRISEIAADIDESGDFLSVRRLAGGPARRTPDPRRRQWLVSLAVPHARDRPAAP